MGERNPVAGSGLGGRVLKGRAMTREASQYHLKERNLAAERMPRSGIRVILDEAHRLGGEILHLEIGQPDLATPAHVIEAAHQAALDGDTGYTPNAGYPSLRAAFADRLSEEQQLAIRPEQVVVSVGAMGAMFAAFCALVSPGDEVLIPDPGYPNYHMPVSLLGATGVPYPLEPANGFAVTAETIRDRISDRTKLIILNSPSNPTGEVIAAGTLEKIIDLARERGIYVLSDEAYDHVVFQGKHCSSLRFDNSGCVVSIFSCSKTYSMTGWRVGFSVSASPLAEILTKLQEMFVSCAPSVSQRAAEAALRGPQDCVLEMLATYRKRRELALHRCEELGLTCIVPKGAFYLMVELPRDETDSMDFALRLVRERRVAVAPGITFGEKGNRFVRLSLCASETTISEGLARLAEYGGG